MSILDPGNDASGPNPAAMYAYATIIAGLYASEIAAASQYAVLANASVVWSRINPATYEPDYVIIADKDVAVVVLAGTTNIPQWLGHAASALSPIIDVVLDKPGVASFVLGTAEREPEIFDKLTPWIGKTIYFVGHSYGGAAANILSLHLASRSPQTMVKILTFGEPKSYVRLGGFPKVGFHGRLIATAETTETVEAIQTLFDPVSLMPPSQLSFFGFGFSLKLARTAFGLGWGHTGSRWYLTPSAKLVAGRLFNPFIDFSTFELGLLARTVVGTIYLHFMATSYLPKCAIAWQASGMSPELQGLSEYSLRYVGNPSELPDNLGPSFTASQLNTQWGLDPGTVTDANKLNFATISIAATIGETDFFRGGATLLGGSSMPANLIPVTFKGTFHLAQDNEGTSESYFYTGSSAGFGYGQMLRLMKTLWPYRTEMSMCSDNPLCINPITGVACTIQNEQIFRDAVTTSMANWPGASFISAKGPVNSGTEVTTNFGRNTYNNDTADTVWKAQFLDGQGHEATQYFHGVPFYSFAGAPPSGQLVQQNQGQRLTAAYSAWLKALNAFCQALVNLELGFRFSWRIWEPAGIKTPDYPAGAPGTPGNSTPLNAFYNLPGFPPNCYTFAMPQSCLATTLQPYVQVNSKGRYRVIVRGMKSLGPINGRWPAIGWISTGPPTGFTGPYPAAGQFCVTVVRRAAQYTWDALGDVCPEAWSAMIPLTPTPLAGSANPPGVANIILGSKKTGRPYDLQRGRSAVRKS